jgi:hypothetical protein
MSFMHYQNSTTYFHRVCIQSGIVRKKLGFEARCYIIVIYLNVGYNIAIYLNVGTLIIIEAINVKIQLSPWLTSSKKFLFERISLAIQRGNAASIRGTFPDSALLSEIFAL